MSKILKCPICGEKPGWDDFDLECRIPNAERAYFCCGVRVPTARHWNRYSSAITFAKHFVKYKEARKILTENDYTPENDHYLVESTIAFNKAGEKVLEEFKNEN